LAPIYDIFRRALQIDDHTVDHAMAVALPTAERRSLQLIALSLLHRNRLTGTRALIEHFDRLPDSVQRAMVERVGDLTPALRETNQHGEAQAARHALRIIERAQATRLAYLITGRLRAGEPETQRAAADALYRMAARAATDPRPGRPPGTAPAEAAFLVEAIEEAITHYASHDQPAALAAWLAMVPRPMPATMHALGKANHPALTPLKRMLAANDGPRVCRALPLLATVSTLREPAHEGLERAAKAGGLGPALANNHLLLWRPAWRAMRACRQPDRLWPASSGWSDLAPHEARGLAAWAESLSFTPAERIERYAALRDAEDTATRLAALRRLFKAADISWETTADSDRDAALEAIAGFCHDPAPSLARMALHFLLRRPYANRTKLLGELLNSPHPAVRTIAGRQFAPVGFARLWENWPVTSPTRRQEAANALIKIDPQFDAQLMRKLQSRAHDDRLRAISMIRELGRGHAFEQALTQLTHDRDEVIASAAVKALGSASGGETTRQLETVLDHTSSRMRANAVEALQQLRSTGHVQRLKEMAHADTNRPRANAIQSLMRMQMGEAMAALTQMLSDERPAHRVSALWLVKNMGLGELAQQVSRLASQDPDPEVQARARQAARALLRGSGHEPAQPEQTRAG